MTKKASKKVANTSTVNVLFTDIGGSTTLHASYLDQMYTARERHNENER